MTTYLMCPLYSGIRQLVSHGDDMIAFKPRRIIDIIPAIDLNPEGEY